MLHYFHSKKMAEMEVLRESLLWSQFLSENDQIGTKMFIRSRAFKNRQTKTFLRGSKWYKKVLKSRLWVFWSKILFVGLFWPFLTKKIQIFKIGKKHFLLMSQGPPIPKIMFPSQKLWPVASGQTDFWPKILIFVFFYHFWP